MALFPLYRAYLTTTAYELNVLWAEKNHCVIPLYRLSLSRLNIKKKFRLKSLKTSCSTGSPLSSEGFDYVYKNVKKNVHLASIAGGTDLVSCFVLGNIYS